MDFYTIHASEKAENFATFNNNINVGSSTTANKSPLITTNKAELVVGTGGQGEINVECPIYVGGFGSVELQSSVLKLESNANIQQTGATTLNNLNGTIFTTANGASPNPTIQATDSINNKSIQLLPNAGAGSYNPATDAGNEVIMAKGATNGTETLELTTWSSTNSSVKVAPTSVSMGAGGTTNTPTTSVICNGTSVAVAPSLTFPDGKVQNSAFTGAGALTGSYTNTNMTIDANGKITALANGTSTIPSSLTPTTLTISPPSNPSPSAGIYNNYNMGAVYSFSGTGGFNNSYTGTFVANGGCKWDFNYNFIPAGIVMKYRINFTFWSGGSWGQTKCDIDFYPNRWSQGQQLNDKYNINNKIDGNDSFGYSNATYAPSGRQYWTYNQAFSGVSGANANFIPHQGYFQLYFTIPNSSYSWSGCIEALDTTSPQAGGMGIRIVAV